MKCLLFTVLIALLPILGISQAASSIDVVSGLEYSYRTLSQIEPNVLNIPSSIETRRDETSKLNWRAGINYNQPITNNLYLKTGLRMASIGYKGRNFTDIRWPSENNGGTWVPDPTLPREIQLIWDYLFLEIPIAVRWEFGTKKITPFIELGTAPSIFLTTKTTTKTDQETTTQIGIDESNEFNKLHLVTFAAFGLNYSINDHLQIFGQPTVRYHVTNLSKGPVKENLYNYGIELGLRKKFGNQPAEK